mmetsp:Transcript_15119/g.44730  ORF Transcript_15119/g.44730 Transcript_15119/m.44730 type:complete len:514 (-) Transcript_15119:11-1552(-)
MVHGGGVLLGRSREGGFALHGLNHGLPVEVEAVLESLPGSLEFLASRLVQRVLRLDLLLQDLGCPFFVRDLRVDIAALSLLFNELGPALLVEVCRCPLLGLALGLEVLELVLEPGILPLNVKRRLHDFRGLLAVDCGLGLFGLDLPDGVVPFACVLSDLFRHRKGLLHLEVGLVDNLSGGGGNQGRLFCSFALSPLLLQGTLRLVHLPPHTLWRMYNLALELADLRGCIAPLQARFTELLFESGVDLFELLALLPETRLFLILLVDLLAGVGDGFIQGGYLLPLDLGLFPQVFKLGLKLLVLLGHHLQPVQVLVPGGGDATVQLHALFVEFDKVDQRTELLAEALWLRADDVRPREVAHTAGEHQFGESPPESKLRHTVLVELGPAHVLMRSEDRHVQLFLASARERFEEVLKDAAHSGDMLVAVQELLLRDAEVQLSEACQDLLDGEDGEGVVVALLLALGRDRATAAIGRRGCSSAVHGSLRKRGPGSRSSSRGSSGGEAPKAPERGRSRA